MSKRIAKVRQWLVLCEFIGGPHDGERPELTAEGVDPLTAFQMATQTGDIEQRVKMSEHWYKVDWTRVRKVGTGTNAAVQAYYVDESVSI